MTDRPPPRPYGTLAAEAHGLAERIRENERALRDSETCIGVLDALRATAVLAVAFAEACERAEGWTAWLRADVSAASRAGARTVAAGPSDVSGSGSTACPT